MPLDLTEGVCKEILLLLESVEMVGTWLAQESTTLFFFISRNVTSERPSVLEEWKHRSTLTWNACSSHVGELRGRPSSEKKNSLLKLVKWRKVRFRWWSTGDRSRTWLSAALPEDAVSILRKPRQ